MSLENYYRLINTGIGRRLKDVVNGIIPGLLPEPVPVKVPVRAPRRDERPGRR